MLAEKVVCYIFHAKIFMKYSAPSRLNEYINYKLLQKIASCINFKNIWNKGDSRYWKMGKIGIYLNRNFTAAINFCPERYTNL